MEFGWGAGRAGRRGQVATRRHRGVHRDAAAARGPAPPTPQGSTPTRTSSAAAPPPPVPPPVRIAPAGRRAAVPASYRQPGPGRRRWVARLLLRRRLLVPRPLCEAQHRRDRCRRRRPRIDSPLGRQRCPLAALRLAASPPPARRPSPQPSGSSASVWPCRLRRRVKYRSVRLRGRVHARCSLRCCLRAASAASSPGRSTGHHRLGEPCAVREKVWEK